MSRLERKAMIRHRYNNSGSSVGSSDGSLAAEAGYGFDDRAAPDSRRMMRMGSEPTSPLSARLPLPMERGYFDSVPITKAESSDSYRLPWSSRRFEEDGDRDSDESFGCSLMHEFDRLRHDLEEYASNDATMTAQRRQMRLDMDFEKLSMKYRAHGSGRKADKAAKPKVAKPHFLDLSAVISPVPMDITTPPATLHGRDACLDTATPRPSFAQRFASADNVHVSPEAQMARRALQPSFAANVVPIGSASNGPTNRVLRSKASQDSLTNPISPTSSTFRRPALRSRRSFENPSEVRRRQKDEWSQQQQQLQLQQQHSLLVSHQQHDVFDEQYASVPQLPEWARHQNRANQLANAYHSNKSSDPFGSDLFVASAVPLGLRSSPMARGVSHDTATANQSSPVRPRLATRASSSALRHRMERVPSSSAFSMAETASPTSPSYPPPMLSSSRGSCSSSNGSDSMPHTPNSTTFIRPLAATPPSSKGGPLRDGYYAAEQKEYMRDMAAHHHARALSNAQSVHSAHSRSDSDELADALSLSQSRTNVTPRANKHRQPVRHREGSPIDDHQQQRISPPRSSSLRSQLAEVEQMPGPVSSTTSQLPYTLDEASGLLVGHRGMLPRPEPQQQQQQQPSWNSESDYSTSHDSGVSSAYVSAAAEPEREHEGSAYESAPGHRQQLQHQHQQSKVEFPGSSQTSSKWSPPTPQSKPAASGRARANSRAEEWASSFGRRFAKGVNAKVA